MFNVNGIIHYKLRIIELFRLDLKNLIKTREREEKLKTNSKLSHLKLQI